MANRQLKPVTGLLLVLNFCMYAIVLGIGGWAMNMVSYTSSLPAAISATTIAWTLTLLAIGFACKEIELQIRNARLESRSMEAFLIILSATQLLCIAAIQGVA
ncbi:uncharacterized protein LOC111400654 [Olea europaea var. sylvestris]|uniref:uncharacterized protein LOC111400654 n=1 Tax=Olea europaea var. sylvestris TaxID=158386 RepID=UPI000C1D46C1|nr:uncharacterized protein LOC111400654 [Olea europaea var. sylvestris]